MRLLSLALKNSKVKKTRTLLTVLGIALAVTAVVAISLTNRSTEKSFDNMVDGITGKSDLWLETASPAGAKTGTIADISRTKGIKEAIPSVSALARIDKGKHIYNIEVLGVDPSNDGKVREYRFSRGKNLSRKINETGETLVGQKLADKMELKLGDKVTLSTESTKADFKITGILDNLGAGNINQGEAVIIPLREAQKLFRLEGKFTSLDILTKPDTDLSVLENRLNDDFPSLVVARKEERVEAREEILRSLRIGLAFFSAIALFVAGFLIYNTLSMSVVERSREIGLLRALGCSRLQITLLTLTEALAIAVAGALLGLLIGVFTARIFINLTAAFYEGSIPDLAVSSSTLIAAGTSAVIVSLLFALQPAIAAGKISPLQALRTSAKESGFSFSRIILAVISLLLGVVLGNVPVSVTEKFPMVPQAGAFMVMLGAALVIPYLMPGIVRMIFFPLRTIFGSQGKLAFLNLIKSRRRNSITVAAIMVSLAMMLSVGGMNLSLFRSVEEWVNTSFGADIFVFFEDGRVDFQPSFTKKLQRVKGIDFISAQNLTPVFTEYGRLNIRAVQPVSFRKFTSFQFIEGEKEKAWRQFAQGGSIFISGSLAKQKRLGVGDRVTLHTNKGPKEFKVAGVIVDFGSGAAVKIVLNRNELKRLFDVNTVSAYRVKIREGENVETVADRIRKTHKSNGLAVQTNEEFREMVFDQVNATFSIFNSIVLVAVVVALVGTANAFLMSLYERRRELIILRAIGTTKSQTALSILLEACLLGLTGALLGLVLGSYLSSNIVEGMRRLTGLDVSYQFPLYSAIYATVIALGASFLASIVPVIKSSRFRLNEALSYQ